MSHRSLDKLDKKILHLISEDARIPFLEVARACNVSGAAIHQRIQKLTNLGILKRVTVCYWPWEDRLWNMCLRGSLSQEPWRFRRCCREALKKIPEVVEAHYTTGGYDLFIKIYAINNHHLLNIIHDKLQPLGLSRSETIISFNAVIDRPLLIIDSALEEKED